MEEHKAANVMLPETEEELSNGRASKESVKNEWKEFANDGFKPEPVHADQS